MLAKVKGQISNDPLWAGLTGLGAALCVATMVFGDLEEGSKLYTQLETWAEAMGLFTMGALGRWRLEKGGEADA